MPSPASPTPCAPLQVLPDCGQRSEAWPLHGVAATRALEVAARARLPAHALMQRAGLAVARLARAVAPHARRVHVLAGPGNNGGDGLEAASLLRHSGFQVDVVLLGDAARLPQDAARSLQNAREAGVAIDSRLPPGFPQADTLVIDALLGLGSRQPPQGRMAEGIAWINAGQAEVLAVDLPSGLQGDTGHCESTPTGCVRASHTLSLLTLKPGLFTARGRDQAGRIWLDTLGLPESAAADAWLPTRQGVAALLPQPGHAAHKGSRGNLLVIGGAPGMSGAALLAARAALASGAGRVYLAPLAEVAGLLAAAPEIMVRPEMAGSSGALASDWTTVCGCGGGKAVRNVLPGLLPTAARLLLDADALNAVAADPELRRLLQARQQQGLETVLTPHPLEAARLLGGTAQSVQQDRLAAASRLAQELQALVVLKGSGSVIAAPGVPPMINPSGNAALATAGTGDVLAGWLGGLWAQGLPASEAAQAAVHAHGAAADGWMAEGRPPNSPLTAGRLLERLHEAGSCPLPARGWGRPRIAC